MYQIDLLDHQEKSGFRVYIRSLIYIMSESHFEGVTGSTLIFRSLGVNNKLAKIHKATYLPEEQKTSIRIFALLYDGRAERLVV